MEFQTKQSSIFIMNMFLVVLAVAMAFYTFFHPMPGYKIYQYTFIVWLLIAYIRLRIYYKYLYLLVSGKPVLIVNEDFICDVAKAMKYHWKDIESISEENGYLFIKLYSPVKYSDDVNPVKVSVTSRPIVTSGINIDMVNVDTNVLLEILDEYSIKAMEIDKR